jgi:hypothetical protein
MTNVYTETKLASSSVAYAESNRPLIKCRADFREPAASPA